MAWYCGVFKHGKRGRIFSTNLRPTRERFPFYARVVGPFGSREGAADYARDKGLSTGRAAPTRGKRRRKGVVTRRARLRASNGALALTSGIPVANTRRGLSKVWHVIRSKRGWDIYSFDASIRRYADGINSFGPYMTRKAAEAKKRSLRGEGSPSSNPPYYIPYWDRGDKERGPFKTYEAARKALRKLWRSGVIPEGDEPIYITPQLERKRRNPHRSSPIYHRRERVRGYTSEISPLAASGSTGKAMLKRRLPDWTQEQHLAEARKHRRAGEVAQHKWDRLWEEAHMATFGRKPMPYESRIAGVGDDRYPEAHKTKLRHYAIATSEHRSIANLHAEAAGRKRRNPRRVSQWYVGRREDGLAEVKRTVSAILEPWLYAHGPFGTKPSALAFVRARGWRLYTAPHWNPPAKRKRSTRRTVTTETRTMRRTVMGNPPRGAVKVYDRVLAIEAKKGRRSLWPNELFRHDFKAPAAIYGMPDGSLMIRGQKNLWREFNY